MQVKSYKAGSVGEVVVADLGGFSAPSSRAARKVLADLGSPRRALLVLNERDINVYKSFRNFPGVKIRIADELCAFDLVAGGLVITEAGVLEKLAARVGIGASKGEQTGTAADATATASGESR